MTDKSVSHSDCYVKNPDVIIREEDKDGVLLFNPDTDQIIVLNHTAFFIWQQCDGERSLPDIIQAVADHFDEVPEEEMADQVTTYVSKMAASGFIGTVEE